MRGMIRSDDENVMDVMSIISLNRLRDGGAAILAAAKRNHHIDIVGIIFISPFIRNILRVCEFS